MNADLLKSFSDDVHNNGVTLEQIEAVLKSNNIT